MKPFKYSLFLALFLLFLAHISFGQSLTAFRAYNNSTITLKTGIGSITPSNVGGNIDSVCRYLSIWDLQQVTNIGARTNNVVAFGRTSSTQTVIDSNGVRNSNNTNLLWQFTNISGKPTWLMGGAEHTYYGIIQPDTFNTLHSWGLRNVSGKFLFDIDTSTFVASKHKLDSVAGLAGSANLQGVLTLGNTTDKTAKFGDGIDTVYVMPEMVKVKNTSGQVVALLGNNGGEPSLGLQSVAGGVPFSQIEYDNNGNVVTGYKFYAKARGGTHDTLALKAQLDSVAGLMPGSHPSGTPTITYGQAAGTSPGSYTVHGDDASGYINFQVGTGVPNPAVADLGCSCGYGTIFTMTFHTAYSHNVRVHFYSISSQGNIGNDVYFTGSNVWSVNLYGVSGSTVKLPQEAGGTGLTSSGNYVVGYTVTEEL